MEGNVLLHIGNTVPRLGSVCPSTPRRSRSNCEGRGHMNVLLAEANVPYDKLKDMDEINSGFANADVALVIGANDVVNPAAKNDKSSPIYGMPILNVDQAKAVIVMKRSMNPGFAGIENELFYDAKTSMLFGDAKASLGKLVTEMKNA